MNEIKKIPINISNKKLIFEKLMPGDSIEIIARERVSKKISKTKCIVIRLLQITEKNANKICEIDCGTGGIGGSTSKQSYMTIYSNPKEEIFFAHDLTDFYIEEIFLLYREK